MSKHNYSQYSNNKNKNENVAVEDVAVTEIPAAVEVPEVTAIPEIDLVEETVETVTLPETITGTVANCAKLNVRAAANTAADVVCVLEGKSEIEIDIAKSTDEWFYVCTAAGIEGYCMRKFVDARL